MKPKIVVPMTLDKVIVFRDFIVDVDKIALNNFKIKQLLVNYDLTDIITSLNYVIADGIKRQRETDKEFENIDWEKALSE